VQSVIAPSNGISGQSFEVSWTVRNGGASTEVPSWYDAVYLSRDQFFDRRTDTYLGAVEYQGGLAAGQSYTQTQSFKVPQGLTGPFYVFVVADGGNQVYERTQEVNNVKYDQGSMQVDLPAPVDLVAGDVSVVASGVPGQQTTITYQVENQGTNVARGNWVDAIYLSKDGQWDINDQLIGRVQHMGDVASGGSYSGSLSAALPGVVPGEYQVIVRTDVRNSLTEGNETNNLSVSAGKIAINAETLQLGTPVRGALGQGQAVYYRIEVAAGQTLQISLDSLSSSAVNELYIRYGEMPSRSQFDYTVDQPLRADQAVVVPTTKAGTYYIMAYGDSVPNNSATYECCIFTTSAGDSH
jgi:hypothetical protein